MTGIGTVYCGSRAYGAKTKALVNILDSADPTALMTHWGGLIYAGSLTSFDPYKSEVLARCPRRNKDGVKIDDGEVYSASLAKQVRAYQSGLTDTTDISGIQTVRVLDEVKSQKWRQFRLEEAVQKAPMPDLVGKVDYISTKLAATAKAPELSEPEIVDSAYTRVSFDLWQNVVHIAKGTKALRSSSHPIMDIDIQQASRALASTRNTQIKTVFEAADGGTAGADWGASSSGVSTNDPYVNINTAIDDIMGNGFQPDIIALDPQVWQEFLSNTWVKDTRQQIIQAPQAQTIQLPGNPDLQVVIDTAMTATIAVVCEKNGWGLLGEGPTEIARYKNDAAGYEAFIIRDWLEVKAIDANAIYKLTGVTA